MFYLSIGEQCPRSSKYIITSKKKSYLDKLSKKELLYSKRMQKCNKLKAKETIKSDESFKNSNVPIDMNSMSEVGLQ